MVWEHTCGAPAWTRSHEASEAAVEAGWLQVASVLPLSVSLLCVSDGWLCSGAPVLSEQPGVTKGPHLAPHLQFLPGLLSDAC